MQNLTTYEGLLKTLYSKKKIENIALNEHPFLDMVKRDTSAAGDFTKQPVIYSNTASFSNTFSQTKTNAENASTKSAGFLLSMMDSFGMCTISDKVIQASRNDEGAFIKAFKTEVDGMLYDVKAGLAANLYRSGFGELGRVSSPGASTTLTLQTPEDALNFAVDQVIVFSDTIGSSALRDSGTSLTIVGVDYSAGTLTVSANVNTITGIADGDYIFLKGTRQNAASPVPLQMFGLEAWIPVSAPSSTPFCGVDRSTNSLLYGQSLDASAREIEAALVEAAAKVAAVRGKLTHFFLNTNKYQELVNSLGTKVQYVNVKDADGVDVGFQGVRIACGGKPIDVIMDPDCPNNRCFGVNLPMWTLWSMGPVASIYDRDGNVSLRQADDAGVEVRSYTYSQLGCAAPSHNINIQF